MPPFGSALSSRICRSSPTTCWSSPARTRASRICHIRDPAGPFVVRASPCARVGIGYTCLEEEEQTLARPTHRQSARPHARRDRPRACGLSPRRPVQRGLGRVSVAAGFVFLSGLVAGAVYSRTPEPGRAEPMRRCARRCLYILQLPRRRVRGPPRGRTVEAASRGLLPLSAVPAVDGAADYRSVRGVALSAGPVRHPADVRTFRAVHARGVLALRNERGIWCGS